MEIAEIPRMSGEKRNRIAVHGVRLQNLILALISMAIDT